MEQYISVVIPVYNAEKYLPTCMDSLLKQTYRKLEIILVDDGSTDGSLSLCRTYEQADHRVLVIHQENQGVSAARNAGIQRASGEYISFIDSDDYVKPDYFQRLHQDITEYAADMVCCDYIEILNGCESLDYNHKVNKSRLLDSQEVYTSIANGVEGYWSCVWGKLIRTSLARKNRFSTELRYGEDQLYMYGLFLHQPVVYLDTYQGYYYYRNEDSATMRVGEYNVKKRLDEMKMYKYILVTLPRGAIACKPKLETIFMGILLAAIISLAIQGTEEDMNCCQGMLRKEIINVIGRQIPIKTRIHFLLFLYCPGVYRWLMRKKLAR